MWNQGKQVVPWHTAVILRAYIYQVGIAQNAATRPARWGAQVPAWCEPEWRGLMEACWEVSPAARPSFRQLAVQLEKILEAAP